MTTKRDILSIAVKIVAIPLFLDSLLVVIQYLVLCFSSFSRWSNTDYILIALIPNILSLILSILLIKLSDKIARILIKEDKELHLLGNFDWSNELFIIVLRIMGVYFFFNKIPMLLMWLARSSSNNEKPTDPLWLRILRIILEIGISLYLIFGAEHLARFINRRKHTRKPSEDRGQSGAIERGK